MKKSKINFTIELDEENIPEKISWEASDNPDLPSETRAVTISLWDHSQLNTMRIDLWTKDMEIGDMKRFYIDCLGGMAQSLLSSTGDEAMSTEINNLCDRLVEHIKKEMKEGNN